MEDDDLAQIRAKRMAEMQAGAGGAGGQQEKAQERAKQMEDMKNGILSQVLQPFHTAALLPGLVCRCWIRRRGPGSTR